MREDVAARDVGASADDGEDEAHDKRRQSTATMRQPLVPTSQRTTVAARCTTTRRRANERRHAFAKSTRRRQQRRGGGVKGGRTGRKGGASNTVSRHLLLDNRADAFQPMLDRASVMSSARWRKPARYGFEEDAHLYVRWVGDEVNRGKHSASAREVNSTQAHSTPCFIQVRVATPLAFSDSAIGIVTVVRDLLWS